MVPFPSIIFYHIQIKTSKVGTSTSKVRFNAEKFSITGTKQKLGICIFRSLVTHLQYFCLEFNFEDLMVSVGGYLGLFIGLALNDVCEFFVDFVDSFRKKIVKKKGGDV